VPRTSASTDAEASTATEDPVTWLVKDAVGGPSTTTGAVAVTLCTLVAVAPPSSVTVKRTWYVPAAA
jgi:hypothetical protein